MKEAARCRLRSAGGSAPGFSALQVPRPGTSGNPDYVFIDQNFPGRGNAGVKSAAPR